MLSPVCHCDKSLFIHSVNIVPGCLHSPEHSSGPWDAAMNKPKSPPRRAYILMKGLDKSDTGKILLNTHGEIRCMILELRKAIWARVQGSEKGDVGVGWDCCREQQRLAWGFEGGQSLEGARGMGENFGRRQEGGTQSD